MSHKSELPVEVVTQIDKEAEAHNTRLKEYAESEKDEAYGQGFAEGWEHGATAYATDRHHLQQENAELRRQNDKLKQQAAGWRPLLEEVLSESNELPLTIELIIKIKTFLYGE